MNSLVEFAQAELDRILATCTEEDDRKAQEAVNNQIMAIIKLFAEQGHSGGSSGYVIPILTRLLKFLPLSAVEGTDDEWEDFSERFDDGHIHEMNTRCGAIFRLDRDNATAIYANAKVFSDDGGETWYTSRKSPVPITFPFIVPNEPEFVYVEKEADDTDEEQWTE